MSSQDKYTPVIGLEVHVELKTKTKMFCRCLADYFGKEPNTHVCPVCLALPGALPVPNKTAIEWCIMIGRALGCKTAEFSKFDRKNYFYPDLPKGYQISQYDLPFCQKGKIELSGGKTIGITRVHMEEDTAKLVHQLGDQSSKFKVQSYSLIDFNRSGVPLVEIVTEPDFESAAEVVEYLKKLQQIVRYLDVSNADMEKGDMRLEPNISLRKTPQKSFPKYKVEVKNINSFRFVERAIAYEFKRQREILEKGEVPAQETRGWDEKKNQTVSQRVKEEAHDYRYFPEPDIAPINSKLKVQSSKLPELPDGKKKRFMEEYQLREDQATILIETREKADFFEEAVKDGNKYEVGPCEVANIIINKKIPLDKLLPAELIQAVIKGKNAGAAQEDVAKAVKEVIDENPTAVGAYKNGKVQILGFLIGQVIKSLPGIAPAQAKDALQKELK